MKARSEQAPNTASALAAQLAELGGAPVEIVINSPGGIATEGAAMMAELRASRSQVTVKIRGVAASAASLIAMGGDEVVIDASALFMIHDPAALVVGPAAAMREAADTLDKMADTYALGYAEASGNRPDQVRRWMIDETWLNAEEAVALNFAHRIEEQRAPEMVAAYDYTRFANAPATLVAMAKARGWATHSPNIEQRKEPA